MPVGSPHTKPILDTSAVTELILDRAREAGNCKVFPIGAGFADDAAFAAVAWLAQGDVQVHQAGRGHQAFGVDGLAGATITLESYILAKCWIAPEIPTAMYSCGATILPV